MATSQNITAPSRFHNLSDAALADEIGRVDSISPETTETELKALNGQFKARGLSAAAGNAFLVTATEQIAVTVSRARLPGHCLFALRGCCRLNRDPDQGGQSHAAGRGLTLPFNPAPLMSAGGVQSN